METSLKTCEGEPLPEMDVAESSKTSETLTQQATRLAAEQLHNNCNELGRGYSAYNLSNFCGRRPADPALGTQRVPETTKAGLLVATHRGLNLLVHDYKTEILRRDKELARAQSESVPSTSEDCDLERKYEHLPLSDLIIADKNIHIKSFTDEDFVMKTWGIVVRASEEVKSSIHGQSLYKK